MSYNITIAGQTAITIADSNYNSTSTSLFLPGPNLTGYGQHLDQNLVNLLQNFSSDTAPLVNVSGQLWYDSGNKTLKVYTSQGYLPVAGIFVQSIPPTTAVVGNTWYNTTTNQYFIYDPAGVWNLVGPIVPTSTVLPNPAQVLSGAIPLTVNDAATNSLTHNIIQLQFGSLIFAVLSKDPAFSPSPAIPGFAVINPGVTINSTIANPSMNTNVVGNLTGNLTGNVLTASQPNITTLSGVTSIGASSFTTLTGTLQTASQTNITAVGTLTNLTATTAVATNFSSGNARISGGTLSGLTALNATTLQATNFSSGNAVISGGRVEAVNYLQGTNFSTGNAQITGGAVSGLSSVTATTGTFTTLTGTTTTATIGTIANLSSTNAQITGGSATGLTGVSATTGTFTTVNATNTTVTTERATNFATGNAQITGGAISGTPVSGSTGQFSTAVVNNFSTANAVIAGGSLNGTPIGATSTSTGAFSTLTATSVSTTGSASFASLSVSGTVAFTNSPTAPTPASTDNSTALATTAFVKTITGTLGTMSSQNSDNVGITGGNISGTYSLSTTGSAAKLVSGNWDVEAVGATLFFKYGGVNVAKLDSAGNFSVKGDITAFGTFN
jgi:hypothetical protein